MDKSFEFCIGEEEESFVLLLDDEAPILEWLFDNLFVFKSFLFSVLSPFSVFVCPEVVDGVSVEFNDSEDILSGSIFPSLLPDEPFSEFGFRPFLPFLEDEEDDETTEEESPPPRSPFPSFELLLNSPPPRLELRLEEEVEQFNEADELFMFLVAAWFEVLFTNSDSRFPRF